jgi:hypothetical protein
VELSGQRRVCREQYARSPPSRRSSPLT